MESTIDLKTPVHSGDTSEESQKHEIDVASGNINETDSSLLCDIPQSAANNGDSNLSPTVGHYDSEDALSNEEIELPNSAGQFSSHDSPPLASITITEKHSEFTSESTVSEFTNTMKRDRNAEENSHLQAERDKYINFERDFVEGTSENAGGTSEVIPSNVSMWKDIAHSQVVLTPLTVAELQAFNCVTPGAIREENKKLLMKRIAQKKQLRLRDAQKRKREDNEDYKSDDDEAKDRLPKKLTRPRSAMKRRKRLSTCESILAVKDKKSDSSDSEPVRKKQVAKISSESEESDTSDSQFNLISSEPDEEDTKLRSVTDKNEKCEDNKVKMSENANEVGNLLPLDEKDKLISAPEETDKSENGEKIRRDSKEVNPHSFDDDDIILSSDPEPYITEDEKEKISKNAKEVENFDPEETYKAEDEKEKISETAKEVDNSSFDDDDITVLSSDPEEAYKTEDEKEKNSENAKDVDNSPLKEKDTLRDPEETPKTEIDNISPDVKEKVGNLRLADFVDCEAEVSGEDSGDEADPEADGEVLETLINDEEISDNDEENLMLHIKQQQNEDEKITNYLKENLIEDAETSNREKKFYWQNKEEENKDGSDKDEDVVEEAQVDIDREKVQFLKSVEKEEDDYKVGATLKIKKIGQGSQVPPKKGSTRKHGSMFGSK